MTSGCAPPGRVWAPERSAGRSDSSTSREPPLPDWLDNWQPRGTPCGPISSRACKPHLMTPPASLASGYPESMRGVWHHHDRRRRGPRELTGIVDHSRGGSHQATPAHGRRLAARLVESLPTCPIPEIARLGRTLRRWKDAFLAYFDTAGASNGPTEAINGHYRTRQTHRQRLPQHHQLPAPNAPHRRRPGFLHPHSTLKSPQMHVSSPRDWTAQINSKHSHTTEPLHARNGSGVQVPLDSRATDRGAPSS